MKILMHFFHAILQMDLINILIKSYHYLQMDVII